MATNVLLENNEARLAVCYFAASGASKYADEFIDHLVLHSLASLDAGGRYVSQIHNKLNKVTGIIFEYSQVLASLERLSTQNIVYMPPRNESDSESKFGLTPVEMNKYRKQLQTQREFEDKIIIEWLDEVRTIFPKLNDSELAFIRDDLITFSKHLYSLHTVESVSLFFGDNDDLKSITEKYDDIRLRDILPERPIQVHEARIKVLPQFFQNANLDRKKYIADHLNPIFALKMLELDPTNAKLISEEFIQGGKLFLDTNILYPLFGLAGIDLQNATKRLLTLSRGLNFEPVVSPKTIAEYKRSIWTRQKNSKNVPPISIQVAQAALEVTSTPSIERTLWEKSIEAKGRLSPEEYYGLFTNVDALLVQYDIHIEESRHEFIIGNDRSLAEEEQKLVGALDWQQGNYEPEIVQHDAYHRLLILDLRQGYEGASPLQTGHWFLTNDSKLPVYDRRVRQSGTQKGINIPFCATSTQWMQMLFPYRGAVEGFETAQVEQLDSPLFRLFRSPEPSLVNKIITRMQFIDQFEPDTIVNLVKKEGFLRDFAVAENEEERIEVYNTHLSQEFQKLRDEKEKLSTYVEDLQKNVYRLAEDNEFQGLEIEEIAEKKREADEILDEALEEISRLSRKLDEFEKLNSALLPSEHEMTELKNTVQELEQELNRVKSQPSPQIPVIHILDMSSKLNLGSNEETIKPYEKTSANSQGDLLSELQKLQKVLKYSRYVGALCVFLASVALLLIFVNNSDGFPWLRDHPKKIGICASYLIVSIGLTLLIADSRYKKGGAGSVIVGVLISLITIIDP